MDNNNIIKYLRYVENKLKNQLSNPNLTNDLRENLTFKADNITEIIERIDFQLKSQEDKQAIRIEWIASLRKRGIETEKKIQTIELYDKIREVMPYLKVLNANGRVQELIDLCSLEMEIVDFSERSFGNNHISRELIIPIFEKLIASEETNTIHPEVLSKVKGLYEKFKSSLNSSGNTF